MMKQKNINYSAGIGDPYWYEWSVGLLYALDMLDADSDIEYITLQASSFQGLDDVIIKHKSSNTITGVQVKHTRSGDTLTYNDFVLVSEEDDSSLISKLAKDWERAVTSKSYSSCEVVLFTNRSIGVRKVTVKKGTSEEFVRPALKKLWGSVQPQLGTATAIDDILVNEEWNPAWQKLLQELSCLSCDENKLKFLKSLSLRTNQEDLDFLIERINEKLKQHFHVDSRVAIQLDQKLCYALREWTTSNRASERITREDLFKALSLAQDVSIGDHNLPVCEPFFQSRIDFVGEIEKILSSRVHPILFLCGEPGSGKTNIINQLANKADSIITLRFHAFRPLSPGDQYISADTGLSDSRSFWSDLLLQIRELLDGHLAECNVPVCNELIGNVEMLRSEVLRLAEEYALIQGTTTVIAIDGIDHAARAGEANNFLATLVPPSAISPHVCFLIAGQPLQHYDLYPDWLSQCQTVFVPPVKKEDILFLLEAERITLDGCPLDIVAAIINGHVNGNTLSAVFAVHECKRIETVEILEERLTQSGIASGIESYYEYIWKKSKEHIPPAYTFLDSRVAAVLCMFTKRITANGLNDIYAEADLPDMFWERLLTTLYPIVVKEDDGFRVFHNDVRIYLEKYIRKDPVEFKMICLHLANYLFDGESNHDMKHEIGFDLLFSANAVDELVKRYTVDYVIEAIHLKRPMSEIIGQLEMVLSNIGESYIFFEWLSFSCAVETLNQYLISLQWGDRKHIELDNLPSVLPCEKRVYTRKLFTQTILTDVIQQLQFLLYHNEYDRANKVLERWLEGISPNELIQQFATNEYCEYDLDYLHQDANKNILNEWGSICYQLKKNCDFSFDDELSKAATALFNSGRITAAIESDIEDSFQLLYESEMPVFHKDIEKFITSLLKNGSTDLITTIMDKIMPTKFSKRINLYLVVWSILNQKCDSCSDEIIEIIDRKLDFLQLDGNERHDESNFLCVALVVFVLSVYGQTTASQFDTLVLKSLKMARGYDIGKNDRGYFSGNNLLLSCVLLGHIVSDIQSNTNLSDSANSMKLIIESVFDDRDGIGCIEIKANPVKQFLLAAVVHLNDKLPDIMQALIFDKISSGAQHTNSLVCFDIWWNYLVSKQANEILKSIFDKWLAIDQGIAWEREIYELHEIAEQIIPVSKGLGWDDEILVIEEVLNNAQVGYSGRKDYSLYRPYEWYESIASGGVNWKQLGLLFLNISHYASETGDNRAAVHIESAVASSIGYKGANDIGTFFEIVAPQNWNEFTVILDAIIAALSLPYFSEDDLLKIWETIVEAAKINHSLPKYDSDNSHKIIYIVDLKLAIEAHVEKYSLNATLLDQLKALAPFEYALKYGPESITFITPARWYDKEKTNESIDDFLVQTEGDSCQVAFDKLTKIASQEGALPRWDSVLGFLYKLKKEQVSVDDYLEAILSFVLENRDNYFWDYDGVYRLLEELFPYLSDEQRIALLKESYDHHTRYKHNDSVYGVNDDIGYFLLWHKNILSTEERILALSEILSTHKRWITAFEKREFPEHYSTQSVEECNITWIELCKKIETHIS